MVIWQHTKMSKINLKGKNEIMTKIKSKQIKCNYERPQYLISARRQGLVGVFGFFTTSDSDIIFKNYHNLNFKSNHYFSISSIC